MIYSLINVSNENENFVDGVWIQNHTGNLESAILAARETEKANSNRVKVAVIESINGSCPDFRFVKHVQRLDINRYSKKAVLFEHFAFNCPYFDGRANVNNGYGCTHPAQEEQHEPNNSIYSSNSKTTGCCYCFSCPLGIEAEEEDLNSLQIDWDGLCEYGVVEESEYLLVNCTKDATDDERKALFEYDCYMHRYDKKWLKNKGVI